MPVRCGFPGVGCTKTLYGGIGNGITVLVAGIQGNKVKLGIDAPDEVTVHRQEVADAIKVEQEPINSKSEELEMYHRRVLVVSNDGRTRSTIANMLTDEGGEVDIASTTACALEFAGEKKYDVAIIDESLQTSRGPELFERLKSSQTGLKGILCAAHPTLDTVDAAIDSGMDHVVQKPVDQAEILQLVEH
jgi:carbon storage regulator CsrA